MNPIISIVGRPNVGKSTLFNRVIGYKKAITEDKPGVTRDRNYGEFEYYGDTYTLVDTGGFEPEKEEGFSPKVRQQIEISLRESSAIIFMLDGKDGLLPEDMAILENLRRFNKPVFCVVNKIDSEKRGLNITEFYETGAEKIYATSALHGIGIDDLLEDIKSEIRRQRTDRFADRRQTAEDRLCLTSVSSVKRNGLTSDICNKDIGQTEDEGLRIAFVGRPNTGKSSIVNLLLGQERMIVSDTPGTTRDAIDTKIIHQGQEIILIDTAGLRKKSRISHKVEEYSVSSAIKSVERADVVNLIIDGYIGVGHQDGGIAYMVASRGRGLCVIINKWDILKGKISERLYRDNVQDKIPHVSYCPILFTSAKTGKNINKIIDININIYHQLKRRIITSELNKYFNEIINKTQLSYVQGMPVKFFYISQAKAMPPTFVIFSNHPELIPEHYKRYIENKLRERYGFRGAPIRLIFRKKK